MLVYIDSMIKIAHGDYTIPNYPDSFVKRMVKFAELKDLDIENHFFVCPERAKQYRYCIKTSADIKFEMLKLALKRLLDDK